MSPAESSAVGVRGAAPVDGQRARSALGEGPRHRRKDHPPSKSTLGGEELRTRCETLGGAARREDASGLGPEFALQESPAVAPRAGGPTLATERRDRYFGGTAKEGGLYRSRP